MARPTRDIRGRRPGAGVPAPEPVHVRDWDELRAAVDRGGSQTLVLEGTLSPTGTVMVPVGADITIDARDVRLVRTAPRREFDVSVGAALTLTGSWALSAEGGSLSEAPFLRGAINARVTLSGSIEAAMEEEAAAPGTASLFQCAGELVLEPGSHVSGWWVSRGLNPRTTGAAIRIEGPRASLVMNGGEVSGTAAFGMGEAPSPAVQVWDGASFSMKGGLIVDNNAAGTSAVNGGGVYVQGGTFLMSGGEIGRNAAYCGGGIYAVDGERHPARVLLSGGTVEGNTAQFIGGGAYVQGEVTLEGGSVVGNAALYGGGVYNGAGALEVNSGSIARNFAMSTQYAGGGVYIGSQGSLLGNGGTIEQNGCEGFGGGIYSKGETELAGTDVTGNLAQVGGGLCNDQGAMTLVAGAIEDNHAVRAGGLLNMGSAVITGGLLAQNTAIDAADDLCNEGDGSLDLSGCRLLTWFPDGEGRRFSDQPAAAEKALTLSRQAHDGELTLHAEIAPAA